MAKNDANKPSPAQSKAGKFQQNSTNMTPASYRDRKNKLQTRVIYNNGVQKCAGLHNQDGKIMIDKISGQEDTYDMLNLNCNLRT